MAFSIEPEYLSQMLVRIIFQPKSRPEIRANEQQSLLSEQLLRRNVKRFREGLAFKAHRLLFHSTLGCRVIKKKKKAGSCAKGDGFASQIQHVDLSNKED